MMAPRRAAIVFDCLYPWQTGGGERVYRRIAELLVERGWQVDYLTRDHGTLNNLEAPDSELPFTVVPVYAGEIYDAEGYRRIGPALHFAHAVHRALRTRRGDYDLVLASALPVLTALAAALGLRGSATALVADWLEVWNWREWRRYSGALAGTAAWVLQSIARRVVPARTVNSAFTAARLSAPDAIILGLVDLAPSVSVREPAADPPYALYVGRHIPDKRVETIPAAIARARLAVPALRAVIVGAGPSTPAVLREIEQEGLGDVIALPGRVSDDELDRLYARAAVLVHPSVREGFGLVVAEASARGVPSVVVRAEGNAAVELVDSGVNGEVAESTDPEHLAAALVGVLHAGGKLRLTTAEWFDRARIDRGLPASVDEIVARYASVR